jgi:hypothetical protein
MRTAQGTPMNTFLLIGRPLRWRVFSQAPVLALSSALWLAPLLTIATGCGASAGQEAEWPAAGKKWFERAEYSFKSGDLDDARHAADNALKTMPDEPRVRVLAARIALAELEFDRSVQLLAELPGTEASAVRGRAYWYKGDVERAADELDALTRDPEVRDAWAKEVAQLARVGRGRRPFEMSGGLLAVTEMPRVGTTAMIVPVEINGEQSLAMIATDSAEAAIDSKDAQGQWVSLRFGGRVEVSDVPAVGRDLSGLKRQTGAPIKMLIGVNLLRHLHATIDFSGSQFVVRNYEAPPPPEATTVHPIFYRGGALVIGAAFGVETTAPTASLLVNTSMAYPVALDEAGWKKAGQDPATFAMVPGGGKLTYGSLPLLRIGAFEVPNVPGVLGAPVDDLEKAIGVDLDGFAGSGLWATFRLTFADQGRTLFIEDLPPEVIEARIAASQRMRAEDEARQPASDMPSGPASGSSQPMSPGSAP